MWGLYSEEVRALYSVCGDYIVRRFVHCTVCVGDYIVRRSVHCTVCGGII